MKSEKASGQHIEVVNDDLSERQEPGGVKVMGTVRLTEGSIVYIPTPTADPQGTLQQKKFAWSCRQC